MGLAMMIGMATAIIQVLMSILSNQQNIEWEGTMNEWY
jgi:hypothetical protein